MEYNFAVLHRDGKWASRIAAAAGALASTRCRGGALYVYNSVGGAY